jgi:hypothetical protein
MARTKISEFSATPANNTDIDSINIAEGCAPSGINDAIRELMAQLKDFQTGAVGDSFNGPIGTTTAAAGAFTTLAASGAVTLSGGTANGVTYLNGSKVLTSGSALVFDGTNLGLGASPTVHSLSGSGYRGFEVGTTAGSGLLGTGTELYLLMNTYFDSGFKYANTGFASSYLQNAGRHLWYTSASGTAGAAMSRTNAMTLDAAGGLKTLNTIGVGNTAPSTSGAGITFPATQSASSNANTLDDYEEGTWTPTDGSSANLTFTNVSGTYTKIGRNVVAVFSITYPTTSSTAQASITGLPFNTGGASGVTGGAGGGIINYQQTNTSAIYLTLEAAGGAKAFWYTTGGGGMLNVTFTGAVMVATLVYQTST